MDLSIVYFDVRQAGLLGEAPPILRLERIEQLRSPHTQWVYKSPGLLVGVSAMNKSRPDIGEFLYSP